MINADNPTFDERFEYLVPQGELTLKKLEISVIEERMMKNYVLGEVSVIKRIFRNVKFKMFQVIIDLDKLDLFKTHTEWFELGPHLKRD